MLSQRFQIASTTPGNLLGKPRLRRNGAHALLVQAIEAEVADFLGRYADLKTSQGHRRSVRHGHLPEREAMTGIGPVAVRQPRVRDREAAAADPGRIHFTPGILPPYVRRSKSVEGLLPLLYLKGISTGDFSEALAVLFGKDAVGLSASTIGRLKEVWQDEHAQWQKRDLSAKRYVYVWADGIYLEARLEDEKQCILVLIGATPEGKRTRRLHGWSQGKCPRLAQSAAPARPASVTRVGDRRRRARLLEGGWRGLAEDARSTLLGAQDRQCAGQVAEGPTTES